MKRILIAMLALAMLLTSMGAFAEAKTYDNPLVYRIVQIGVKERVYDDTFAHLNELTNERFNFTYALETIPEATAMEKLNIQFASGDIADLYNFTGNRPDQYRTWGLGGYLVNILDYLDYVPNYRATWSDVDWDLALTTHCAGDGALYGFVDHGATYLAQQCWNFRMDYFRAVGYENAPATTEELYDALLKYKEQNPDAIPIANRWGLENFLVNGWTSTFRTGTWYYDLDSETFEYGPTTQKYRDMVIYLNRLYKAGLVDPEFATATDTQWKEIYAKGLNMAEFSYTTRPWLWNDTYRADMPEIDWIWTGPIAAYDEPGLIIRQNPIGVMSRSITRACDEEKILRYMDYVNWACTQEGFLYAMAGDPEYWVVEGDTLTSTYKRDDPEGTQAGAYNDRPYSLLPTYYVYVEPYEEMTEMTRQAYIYSEEIKDMDYRAFLYFNFNFNETDEYRYNELCTALNDIHDEWVLSFIMGNKDPNDDAQWKTFQDTLNAVGLEEALTLFRANTVAKYEK